MNTIIFDLPIIVTMLGTGVAIIAFVHAFFRNFKADVNARFEKLERKIDTDIATIRTETNARFEDSSARFVEVNARINSFEARINSIDERLFFVLTGKNLEDVIKEEKIKRSQKI